MDKLLIIDGNALIHRAYHALPSFKTMDGIPTNAVYGFASMLHRTIEDFQPSHVLVCFDTAAKTFRDELYKEYRAHRPEADNDLILQFPMVREFLNAAVIPYIEKDGFEADDLIASVCKKFSTNIHCLVLTGDKDIFQLVDDRVIVTTPLNGDKNLKIYDHDEVVKKFGVDPNQIPDFKALAGDPSDNYKGVAGVGPKTATELIQRFGSVEELYKKIEQIENPSLKQKLIDGKESALMSKELAVLKKDIEISVSIEDTQFKGYNDSLGDFFEKYSFRSLAGRMMRGNQNRNSTIASGAQMNKGKNDHKRGRKKQPNLNQLDLF